VSAALLEVRDLRVQFGTAERPLMAVNGVSFDVGPAQTVAIVGESGSGKSLTSLALLRLTPPGSRMNATTLRLGDTDIAALDSGQLSTLRGRRIAMVFQSPSAALNPVLTIGRQITEVLRRHYRMRGSVARSRAIELLETVEIPEPQHRFGQYPHQLSGGMRQRAMIAMALAAEPELLIADEPTTALDVTLQAQIMDLLARLQGDLGMALLLISHDLSVVAGAAHEVNVMYAGQIVEHADVRTLFRSAAHPYTRALLQTVRELESDQTADLSPIPGSPPVLGRIPPGCPFNPRCPIAVARCHVEAPILSSIEPGHEVACHLATAAGAAP